MTVTEIRTDEAGTPGVRRVRVQHPQHLHDHRIDVEVAEVPALGMIARWPTGGRDLDGKPLHHFWKFDPSGKRLESPLRQPNGDPRGNEAAQFETMLKTAWSSRPLR